MWKSILLSLTAMVTLTPNEAGSMIRYRMPGTSFHGAPPPLSKEETSTKQHIDDHLHMLSSTIGERHVGRYNALDDAATYIQNQWRIMGYKVALQSYEVRGHVVHNIEIEKKGTVRPQEILIIGAHYDTVPGSPGADDNGSGVAALLEMARLLQEAPLFHRTVRLVAFVNEEPPFYMTEHMGSLVYAKRSKERGEAITGMISLETIGYFTNEKHSQRYVFPLRFIYPHTGNFLGFVSNLASSSFLTKTVGLFRKHTLFPSEGGAWPEAVTGVGFSDHASFWKYGYKAIMVTDTAFYRYPHYHTEEDTTEKVNSDAIARITHGLARTVQDLANF